MENLEQLSANVNRLGNSLESVFTQLATMTPADPPPVPPLPVVASPTTTPHQPRKPYIPIPASYSGDLGICSQFLYQCSLVFSQQPATYPSDQAKVAFISRLLSDQAAAWVLASSTNNPSLCSKYQLFSQEMRKIFHHPVKGREAVSQLLSLKQGNRSMSEYSVTFHILVAESGWDQSALQGVFFKGLSEEVKDKLAVRDETTSLDALIDLAIRLDSGLRERRRERADRHRSLFPASRVPPKEEPLPAAKPSETNPLTTTSAGEPMELGRTRHTLTRETKTTTAPSVHLL